MCCLLRLEKEEEEYIQDLFPFCFVANRGAYLLIRYYSTRMPGKFCLAEGHNEGTGQDLDLPLFDLAAIINATDDFSIHNKLGEGGYGPVYKVMTNCDS